MQPTETEDTLGIVILVIAALLIVNSIIWIVTDKSALYKNKRKK